MKLVNLVAVMGMATLVVACAQQREPNIIHPEPMHDKFGGGSCIAGYTYVPGTGVQQDTCIPDDECQSSSVAGAADQCLPGDGRNSRNPGAPGTTAPSQP